MSTEAYVALSTSQTVRCVSPNKSQRAAQSSQPIEVNVHELLRPLLNLTFVMLLIVVPFLFFGKVFEEWWQSWSDTEHPQSVLMAVIVALLAADIFLPVPSSMVSTAAGWHMSVLSATLVCWTGLNLGCMLGFYVARRWGSKAASWFSRPEELEKMRLLSVRHGPWILATCRGAPVFAEATVLLTGMHGLSWRRFLPPVLLSNLAFAMFYAICGDLAQKHEMLSVALGVSIGIPILLVTLVKLGVRQQERQARDGRANGHTSNNDDGETTQGEESSP